MGSVANIQLFTVLKFVFFLIASWILIHIFSVLGLFFAIAYPIWWFIKPDSLLCLGCRVTKPGDECSYCRKIVDPKIGLYPKTFASVVKNTFIVLFLVIISIGVVYLENFLISTYLRNFDAREVNILFPTEGNYRLEEIFPMSIDFEPINTAVNATQIDLRFDTTALKVLGIDTSESFATIFVQKDLDNNFGFVRVNGGLPNPGFFGESANFVTIYFQAIAPGVSEVEFLPTSMALANDGKGTNLLKRFDSASYFVSNESLSEWEKDMQISKYNLSTTPREDQKFYFDDTEELEDVNLKLTLGRMESGQVLGSAAEGEQDLNFFQSLLSELKEFNEKVIDVYKKLLGIKD